MKKSTSQIRSITAKIKGVGPKARPYEPEQQIGTKFVPPREKFDVRQHIAKGVVKNNDVNIHRGLGLWVWDKHGDEYLDMTSGIGVLGTGHCHPRVVSAIKEQAEEMIHAQQAMFYSHTQQDAFIEKFLQYLPHQNYQFLFTSSGSEATENAVKVAKMHTQRPNVVVMHKGFHGRTFGAMAWSSSKTSYKSGCLNNMGGTFFVPEFTKESFDAVLEHQTAPNETACVMLEPVQGEGGVNQVPKEFLEHVRRRCDEHGIVLIFDEVQCGVGRCGSFWAHDLVGVKPDVTAFAKAIASGMPMGGICAPSKFFQHMTKNSLGGTYGGNPVCLAAANATLDVIRDEELIENANKMGALIAKEMSGMPYITGIRQHGLLIAADLEASHPVGKVIKKAIQNENLVLHSCGANALRIIPAYLIQKQEVEIFCERLHNVLSKNVGADEPFSDFVNQCM